MKNTVSVAAMFVVMCGCSPADDETRSRQPANGVDPLSHYVATARSLEFPTPDTGSVGSFAVQNGCLVFVTEDDSLFLPVFPADTRRPPPSPGASLVVLNGTPIEAGRRYTVKGGVSEYFLDPPAPEACPDTTFLVGGLL